jgi:hypothetical protein
MDQKKPAIFCTDGLCALIQTSKNSARKSSRDQRHQSLREVRGTNPGRGARRRLPDCLLQAGLGVFADEDENPALMRQAITRSTEESLNHLNQINND